MDRRSENNLESLPSFWLEEVEDAPAPAVAVEALEANEIVEAPEPDKESGPEEAEEEEGPKATVAPRESVDSCLISSG